MVRADLYNCEYWIRLARQSAYKASLLSKELNVSRRQLQRYTRKLFGRSPQDWLSEQRVIEAAELLKVHRSAKLVASNLGFRQASHFSREFKLHYGLSPTAFLAKQDLLPSDTGQTQRKMRLTDLGCLPESSECPSQITNGRAR